MILVDTNVLIYAFSPDSTFHTWSRRTLAEAAARSEAFVNAVILAELCVGDSDPKSVLERVRSWGVERLDLPAAAAPICATAFRSYLLRREDEGRGVAVRIPLPDFFIGSHAQLLGCKIATADLGRYQTYFPKVNLLSPWS